VFVCCQQTFKLGLRMVLDREYLDVQTLCNFVASVQYKVNLTNKCENNQEVDAFDDIEVDWRTDPKNNATQDHKQIGFVVKWRVLLLGNMCKLNAYCQVLHVQTLQQYNVKDLIRLVYVYRFIACKQERTYRHVHCKVEQCLRC
jgi:hypothetical protein